MLSGVAARPSRPPTADDIADLEAFAFTALDPLRLSSGLYCFDRDWATLACRGESLRYTLMVALGVSRWQAHHGDAPVDPDQLVGTVFARRGELDVGDLALLSSCLGRLGPHAASRRTEVLGRLSSRSSSARHVDELAGMEIGWFVWATADAVATGACDSALFDRAWAALQRRRSPRTGLFAHAGDGSWRAGYPNFATEVYALLALSEVARHGLRPAARDQARHLADVLIALRRSDGGWPWLYHLERGVVVEPYELYSVHQDAMAPMALFALSEVTGERGYAAAAIEGYEWCFGANELGVHLYDHTNAFVHRSIKRRGLRHRAHLWGNTALSRARFDASLDVGERTVNTTCRPYHLGWILEAWSGREELYAQHRGGRP